MNTFEQNKNTLLKEIVKNYFSRKEISEFTKKYFTNFNDIEGYATGKKKSEQFKIETEQDPHLRIKTDLLITFAESKLKRNKFLELLLSLGQMAITTGEFSLAIDIYEKIIAESKDKNEYLGITAAAYLSLGELNSRQAHWQLSINNIKRAEGLFEKQKDSYGKANCENLLGTIYGEMGDIQNAQKYFENSLSLIEDKQDYSLIGKIEINLGIINNIRGNYDAALAYYQRALINFEKLNNLYRIAEIRHNMGMTYIKLNQYKSALKNFDQSISAALQTGSLNSLGIAYLGKAYHFTSKKDLPLAEAFSNKAMDICYKINDKLSIAEIYKVKGIVQRLLSDFETSENYLLTSLRINKEFNNKLNYAETNFELGILFKDRGNEKVSKFYFKEAQKYFKTINALPELKVIREFMN